MSENKKQACSNKHECHCPYTSCANHGKCCDCVANHRAQGNVPMCFTVKKDS